MASPRNLAVNDEQAKVLEAALLRYADDLQPNKVRDPVHRAAAYRAKAIAVELAETVRVSA